jgi:hypothetical protein
MFCASGLIFSGTEGVGSRFHVLRARTHFQRHRGRQVPFSFFALLDSFSTVSGVSSPIFLFCAPGLVFGGTEGVGSCFHVLRAHTCFWQYRGRRVPFSFSVLLDSFSAVPRALGPVFMSWAVPRASSPFVMFCAFGLVFSDTVGIGYRFHVLRARTHFRRYRGHWVSFSCFARSYSFSVVPRASGLIFIFCPPGLIFGGTKGVESRFHVLHARTRFQWYRGRRFPFSCFTLPDSLSTVPSASHPVFIFSAPGYVFGSTEGVGSRFHVLHSRTRFRRNRDRRVPFSCFACPDFFSAIPRASGPVFMFCAPGLVFSGIEGVPSRFHVFRSRTCFRRYRGCRVPYSCLAHL